MALSKINTLERVRTKNQYSLSVEELAIRQIKQNSTQTMSPGVSYARKKLTNEKNNARHRILSIFKRRAWEQGLSILTMPGLHWGFEKDLLSLREGNWQNRTKPARHTHITAAEIDPTVYAAAVLRMPRKLHTPIVTYRNSPMWTAHTTGSDAIMRFHNCDVFNLMEHNGKRFGAAWLDFLGPMSWQKIEKIREFYETWIDGVLIVTTLAARQNQDSTIEAAEAGSLEEWLERELRGDIIHCFRYQDESPMLQYAVEKTTSPRVVVVKPWE